MAAFAEAAPFETNFFRMAGTPEVETSVSRKAKCLLAIGEGKTGKLFAVTFSLNHAKIAGSNLVFA